MSHMEEQRIHTKDGSLSVVATRVAHGLTKSLNTYARLLGIEDWSIEMVDRTVIDRDLKSARVLNVVKVTVKAPFLTHAMRDELARKLGLYLTPYTLELVVNGTVGDPPAQIPQSWLAQNHSPPSINPFTPHNPILGPKY